MAPICSELGLVNAFIGTGGYGYGVGSLSPAAQLPFGALRLGPDTASSAADAGWRHASGYNWADSFVRAFSHTRLVGAGVVDLGNVGVMPLLLGPEPEAGWRLADFGFAEASEPGAVDHTPLAWWSLYDRASEAASPGRYSVDLLGPNATAEMLAASTYAGIHRYTFHGATAHAGEVAEPALAVDVCHASGYALPDLAHGDGTCLNASFALSLDGQTFDSQVHFQGRLSGNVVTAFVHGALPAPLPAPSPARTWRVCDRDHGCRALAAGESVTSSSGVLFALGRLASTSAELRVGLSFMSPALARANLAAALDAVDATATATNAGSADDVPPTFEALAAATETVWCSALAGLVVSDSPGDPTLPTLLHSAHYRTYLSPTVYSEPAAANGEYTGLDQQLHSAADDALALGGCPVPQRLSNKAAAPASNASSEAATETSAAAAQALLISSPSGGSSDPASFEAWATASQALSVAHFSDLSNWDTFRSVLPWLLLTQEPVAVGLMRSMAAMTQQQGAFPRWPLAQHESDCMIGNHAASLLVDALLVFTDSAFNATTGAPGEPFACGTWAAVAVATAAAAQPALLRQATVAGAFMGRVDLAHYLRRGFVSLEADDGAAVSTLTYAFDDYLLGVLSQRLADLGPGANGGLDPAPLADAAADALRRAANYQTVFSREHLYMCPRSNGTGNYSGWLLGAGSDAAVDDDEFPGEPLVCPAGATHVAVGSKWYREGDAWHYAYWAPHDVPGLVALHSSPAAFHASLAAVMAQSTPNVVAGVDFQEAKPNNYYWAGNEHNLLNPFLFNYGPNCSAAQYWSRRMTELHYHDGPAGLPGNDDYGAMTTWLLFASLGFFPNAGAGGLFLLGAPRVANATVRLNAFAQPTAAAAAVLGAAASAKPKAASAASFTVVAHDQGPGMYFVRRLLIDGADWASPFLPRAVLANGPTLEFFLTSDPAESGLCPHAA